MYNAGNPVGVCNSAAYIDGPGWYNCDEFFEGDEVCFISGDAQPIRMGELLVYNYTAIQLNAQEVYSSDTSTHMQNLIAKDFYMNYY